MPLFRFLLALLLLINPLQAAGLRLAFNTLEPWKQYDAAGRASGAYTEIARELARRLDLQLEIVDCPLKRCLAMLAGGRADLAVGLQRSPERDAYLAFLATPYRLHSADKVFYLRREEAGRLARYDDLLGLRLGVKLGSELFDRFDADPRLDKQAVPENATNFRKLLAGRVDAVALAEDQGEFLLATLGLAGKVAKAPYRESDGSPRSVALARSSPHYLRLAEFEAAMAAMRRDGTLRRIYQQHYYRRYGIDETAVRVE